MESSLSEAYEHSLSEMREAFMRWVVGIHVKTNHMTPYVGQIVGWGNLDKYVQIELTEKCGYYPQGYVVQVSLERITEWMN